MKRLVICTLSGGSGELRSYLPGYLQALKETADVVCAGSATLSSHAQAELTRMGVEMMYVPAGSGIGMWVEAWKQLSQSRMEGYDEVVMSNDGCIGPVYPLQEMYERMSTFSGDAWSVSMTQGYDTAQWDAPGLSPDFLVLRKSLFQDNRFTGIIRSFRDTPDAAAQFNRAISANGFSTTSYVNPEAYAEYEGDWLVWCADRLLQESRCPLVKRAVFTQTAMEWLRTSNGQVPPRVMRLLESSPYDTDKLWNDLLENERMSQLRTNLHLNYVVPEEKMSVTPQHSRTALILFVYYEELVDYCMHYAQNMPEGSRIFIISAKESLLEAYREAWSKTVGKHQVEFRRMENRGRDVSAYLVAAADVYSSYDYVCCMHDKKSRHIDALLGSCFSDHCFENNLATAGFVCNVIDLFERHPRLGMLVPPTLAFGRYYMTLGDEMGDNAQEVQKAYRLLNLSVPFDDEPVAAFGTMFWVRGKAFERMFSHQWEYGDFPAEPLPLDGSLLHGLERTYQLAVQEAGYYTAWLSSDTQAALTMDNHAYMLRNYNADFFLKLGLCDFPTCSRRLRRMYEPSLAGGLYVRLLYLFKQLRYRLLSCASKGKRKAKYQKKAEKYQILQSAYRLFRRKTS